MAASWSIFQILNTMECLFPEGLFAPFRTLRDQKYWYCRGAWDHLFPDEKRSFGDLLVVNFADSGTSVHSFFSTSLERFDWIDRSGDCNRLPSFMYHRSWESDQFGAGEWTDHSNESYYYGLVYISSFPKNKLTN